MPHDDSQRCVELNGPAGSSRRVMAPVLGSVPPGEMWSPCSARFLTDFLDDGHGTASPRPRRFGDVRSALPRPRCGAQRRLLLAGRCLSDKPTEWLRLPAALPGAAYPADRQCQLAFGPESRHCGDVRPPCAALWCSGIVGGRAVCQSKHFPWADGTPCAPGRACASGECVDTGTMERLRVSAAGQLGVGARRCGFAPRVAAGGSRRWAHGVIFPCRTHGLTPAWGSWGGFPLEAAGRSRRWVHGLLFPMDESRCWGRGAVFPTDPHRRTPVWVFLVFFPHGWVPVSGSQRAFPHSSP